MIHIAVHGDYGVIHYHTQHHNKRRKGHCVEVYLHYEHHRQSNGRTHRDSGTGYERRLHGEQHHHHQNHHEYRNHQIPKEREHRVGHHLWLIGNLAHGYALRELRTELVQSLVQLFPKRHYVVVREHLHRNDNCRGAIVVHIGFRIGIASLYSSYILESQNIPVRVTIHYHIRHLLLGGDCPGDMYRRIGIVRIKTSARHLKRGGLITKHQGGRIDTVRGQFLPVHGDGYFLASIPVNLGGGQHRNAVEHFTEPVRILLHLGIALVGGAQCYQRSRYGREIIQDNHRQHARRKRRLDLIQLELNLGPYPVLFFGRNVEI